MPSVLLVSTVVPVDLVRGSCFDVSASAWYVISSLSLRLVQTTKGCWSHLRSPRKRITSACRGLETPSHVGAGSRRVLGLSRSPEYQSFQRWIKPSATLRSTRTALLLACVDALPGRQCAPRFEYPYLELFRQVIYAAIEVHRAHLAIIGTQLV
ncbi:hypothetical protein PR003_g26087 [Phytophthora rubi]|uniref:Uncharacterized protein n=1 Tax=Phytophthora rubi TaxID=129364 RepID=A0A6A4CBC7_9STRA|nr:hypothetical protein PR003_g26087 [Phytophthora rubi]